MAQSFRTAISFDGLASASSQALAIKVDGDTQNRVLIDAGGKITWGAGGSSAGDTTLYRSAANNLKTDDTFEASGLTISGNAAFDTNTLYVDATNNRVGIGNYPATTLDVQGTINQPWGNAFTQDGVENTKFIDVNFTGGLGNHVDLSVPNNGSAGLGDTVMRLVDGGNVGIGAATPDTALHVSNSTDTVAHFESTDAEGMIAFSDSASTGNWYDRRIGVHGDDLSFVTNGARRMTIQDDGQVGIGTTTPFAPLQVFNSATDTVARLGSGDNGVYISFYDSGSTNETNARLGAYNDSLVFLTAGSDRMVIKSDGDVGIGTTSPSVRLHVNAGTTNNTAIFESTNAGALISLKDDSTSGDSYVGLRADGDILKLRSGNANQVEIAADGNATFEGVVRVANGSNTAPSLSFDNDNNTGFYVSGNDGVIRFVGNGTPGGWLSSTGIRTIDGSAATPSYSFTSDSNTGMLRSGDDELGFATGGTQRLTMDSSGNVGIGTTSPGQRLHVNSGTTNTAAVFESSDTEVILGLKDDTTSGNGHVGIRATGDDLSLRAGNTNQVVIYSGGTAQFAGAVIATDGTASAPGLSFTSDTDTGMFREGADILALTTGGTKRVTVGSGGDVTLTGKLLAADGTASAPSLSFASDPNTGLYATGNFGVIQFSGNGTVGGYLYWGGVRTVTGSASVPTYSFSDDTDTGMYRSAANEISFTTAGSQRAIIKSDGDFAVDTDTLLVDASQDRVGVNHSSPVFPLHAYGATVDSIVGVESGDAGAYVAFIDSDSTGNSYDRRIGATGDDLKFQTTATDRMTIKADGKVGIGTTSPGATLHANSGTADTVAVFESSDTGAYIGMKDDTSGSNLHVAVAAIGNDLALRSGNSNTVRIKGDTQRVGIGTIDPQRVLEVADNVPAIRLTDDNNAGVYHEILGDGASLSIEADDNNQASSSSINFKVDGTEFARLTSDGFLGIGSTGPGRPLEIKHDFPAVRLKDTSTSDHIFHDFLGDGDGLSIRADANGDATSPFINFQIGGSQKAVITNDGRLGIGTGSPSLPLHVATGGADHGILVQSTDSVARINMQDNSSSDAYAVGVGATGDALSLFAGGAERVTIASGGAATFTGNITTTGLTLGSTAVTSTAAELNILDGVTATASELNILDGVTSTASELNLVDGITAGTVSASKAVIADSNKDVTGFRNVTATGIVDAVNFKVNGGQGSDGQVLTSTGSGVAWEDATGGGGSPGGSNTQIQFNNSGSFGGSSNLTFDGTNLTLAGDATIGDTLILTGDSVSHLSNNTSSGREILQLRAKTATSDGAGINLYGSGDSSNAGKVIFFSSGSASLTLDASGNIASTGNFTLDGDIFGTSDTNFFVGNDSNERILFQESSNQIFFYVNGEYRCYVTNTGDFVPYGDSTYDLGSTSLRWAQVHADRYYVNDTDSYIEFEADSAAGIDGPGIRFVINGSEMFKVARENDDSNDTMLLLGENNDGIRYRKDDEKFAVVIGSNDRFCVENATSSIYGSADILNLYTTASGDQSGYIGFYNNGTTRYGYMGYPANDDMYFKNENSGGQMYNISPGSYIYWHVAGAYELRLSSSSLRPYSNEGLSLGESGAAWNHFYLGQGNTFSSGGYWTLRSRDSDRQVMEYTSSERFKKDIVDLPLDEAYQVLDARPIKFRGIDDDSSVPLEAGLSAESLHNSGFEYAVRYDEGHWGETPRAVYYEMLTAPLIKICKDQKDRIESLEAKVAALEAA